MDRPQPQMCVQSIRGSERTGGGIVPIAIACAGASGIRSAAMAAPQDAAYNNNVRRDLRGPNMPLMPLSKRFLAELIGTFWLVLGGCGSAVLSAAFPAVGIGLLGVALAFGLT